MSSGFIPPQTNFLRIAQEAQQSRRQAEQDRLQQLQAIQQRQDRAEQLGIQALQMGGKLKDVEVSYGADAGPQTVARWRILADAQKAKKQEAESQQAGAPILSQLQQLAAGGFQGTPEYSQGISDYTRLVGQESAGPQLEGLNAQGGLAPLLRAIEQMDAQQAFEQALQKTQAEAAIKGRQKVSDSRQINADKLAMGNLDRQVTGAQAAKSEMYADQIANAMQRSSQDPEGLTRTLMQVQGQMTNPALEMPAVQAKANGIWSAAQEPNAIVESYRSQGYTIPKSLGRAVTNGDAHIDEFTGLISVDPGEKGEEMRQARASSMYAMVELEEISKRLVSGPLAGKSWSERQAWVLTQSAKHQVGEADGLYEEYRNRRDMLVATMARANFTGQMSNQERAFVDALVGQERMLAGNKDGTGLAPQLQATINSLYAATETKYRSAIPRGVFDDKKLREAIDRGKKEHAEGFRSGFIEVQYPQTPSADGWERLN